MTILQAVADHNGLSGDKDKVVVVSEWTATLDVIQVILLPEADDLILQNSFGRIWF